jgi:hypothetical protein
VEKWCSSESCISFGEASFIIATTWNNQNVLQ